MTRAPVFLLAVAIGCAGRGAPKARAADAIVAVASVVRAADRACAVSAIAARDVSIADACATAYGAARESLITAAIGLDVWDSDASRTACAIVDAVKQVRTMGAGGPAAQTALSAAILLVESECKR